MFEVERIGITREDGRLAIMQIITRAPLAAFSPDVAIANGFILSEDGEWWEGGITDEGVEMEIAKTPGLSPNRGWVRLTENDIPVDRSQRNAWEII